MLRILVIALSLLASAVGAANAQHARHGDSVMIKDAWARATAGGAKAGAAYVTLSNSGSMADRLLSATSSVAGKVELHTMTMEGDVMKMRQIQSIDVNPGASVELKPGGLHIMLLDLKSPLKEGEKFPLMLTFEKAGTETVTVDVKSIGATGSGKAMPMHQ